MALRADCRVLVIFWRILPLPPSDDDGCCLFDDVWLPVLLFIEPMLLLLLAAGGSVYSVAAEEMLVCCCCVWLSSERWWLVARSRTRSVRCASTFFICISADMVGTCSSVAIELFGCCCCGATCGMFRVYGVCGRFRRTPAPD